MLKTIFLALALLSQFAHAEEVSQEPQAKEVKKQVKQKHQLNGAPDSSRMEIIFERPLREKEIGQEKL